MNDDYIVRTTLQHSTPRRTLPFLLLLIVAIGLILPACGDDDAAVARDKDLPLDLSPTALDGADVPEGVEDASLTVTNGQFKETELVLQVGQPTRLSIRNDDDMAYQFEIVPDLVDKSDVPANVTSVIDFTNPDAGTYHARLLDGDGITLRDELTVVVQTPDDAAD